MVSVLLLFFVGLSLLLVASRILLYLTQELAAGWRLSPLFISVVIISALTTLPEAIITGVSLYEGHAGLALGNALGSTICNLLLLLGIGVVMGSVKIGHSKTQKNAVFLMISAISFIGVFFFPLPNEMKSLILMSILFIIVLLQYLSARHGRDHEDKALLSKIKRIFIKKKKLPVSMYVSSYVVSVLCLVAGGFIVVQAVEGLSQLLNLSTTVLGLSLTSVATSAPELVTTVISAMKKENKVLVGTLFGASMYNLTLFPAATFFYRADITIDVSAIVFLIWSVVLCSAVVFHYRGKVIPRFVGGISIVSFFVFVVIGLKG